VANGRNASTSHERSRGRGPSRQTSSRDRRPGFSCADPAPLRLGPLRTGRGATGYDPKPVPVGTTQDLRSPDTRHVAIGYDPEPVAVAVPEPSGSGEGFDWVSAAIGAVAVGGLILLLVGFMNGRGGRAWGASAGVARCTPEHTGHPAGPGARSGGLSSLQRRWLTQPLCGRGDR
jgi:hypothetical protein